jgi:hypothetical protein
MAGRLTAMGEKCKDCSKPVTFIHYESGYDGVKGTVCSRCSEWYECLFSPKEHEHQYETLEARGGFIEICRKCGKPRPEVEKSDPKDDPLIRKLKEPSEDVQFDV